VGTVEMDVRGDMAVPRQPDPGVIDVGVRRLDQADVVCYPAVVLPVRDGRWNGRLRQSRIGADRYLIVAAPKRLGDLEDEGREATFVLADQLAVQVDASGVVGRPEA
jgi:hypothetical protein